MFIKVAAKLKYLVGSVKVVRLLLFSFMISELEKYLNWDKQLSENS